ncbi:spore germination protein [Paenibacillus curdlanolyticus YK9]|uniref:Spore germination protein n=1 Tax=Paenibacillus curdlanolyticus YK9 TaxID=717606 RepID=E0I3X0_9BACL|nr:GerAB/ArcD/ProY family transporter [Paenibacillus curdlanolyticus]EFM12984.1 spore germination protein [Paenibacillus curdlanolyticus YK9]
MSKIGTYSLFVMIMMFHIGSTPLFLLGSKAKQDSWLAVLLGALIGLVMMAALLMLHRKQPDAGLVGLLRLTVGSWGTGLIGMLYVIYFAYQSMRNVRDFGELTSLSLLQNRPQWLIMGIIVVIAWYTVLQGNESFFRTSQLLFIATMSSYLLLAALIVMKGMPKLQHVRPIMEMGFKPIFHAAVPDIVSFPFTQGVLLLVFWKEAADRSAVSRATYGGYIAGALFIVLMNFLVVSVLGPLAPIPSLPFLEMVQLVQIANFLERLDIIVTLLLFIGLYIKLTAFYLGATLVLRELVNVRYWRLSALVGAAIYAAAFLERNNTTHLWIGLGISLKVSLIMQVGIPLLLLLLALIRLGGAKHQPATAVASEEQGG